MKYKKSQFGLVLRFRLRLFFLRFWLCNVELCFIHNLLDLYFCLAPFLWSKSLQSGDEAQQKQFVLVPWPVGKWGAIVFHQPFCRGRCTLRRRQRKWLLHQSPFPSSFAAWGDLWSWWHLGQNSQLGHLCVLRHWRELRHKRYLGLEVRLTRRGLRDGLRRFDCLGRCRFSLHAARFVVGIVVVVVIVAADVCHSASWSSEGSNKIHKLSVFPSTLHNLSLLLAFDLHSDFLQVPVPHVLPFSFALLSWKSEISECKQQESTFKFSKIAVYQQGTRMRENNTTKTKPFATWTSTKAAYEKKTTALFFKQDLVTIKIFSLKWHFQTWVFWCTDVRLNGYRYLNSSPLARLILIIKYTQMSCWIAEELQLLVD